jgi:hypothetical protein
LNNKIAVTGNLMLVKSAVERSATNPGLIVVSGKPGLGKTTACNWLLGQNPGRCTMHTVRPGWTPLSGLQAILRQLGISNPPGRIDPCEVKIHQILLQRPGHFLIFDESNLLLNKKNVQMLDHLKSIFDATGTPMFFFSEKELADRFQDLDKYRRRAPQFVSLKPASLEDIICITKNCTEVRLNGKPQPLDLDLEIMQRILEQSKGMIGEICQSLKTLEARAAVIKSPVIKLPDMPDELLPTRRAA